MAVLSKLQLELAQAMLRKQLGPEASLNVIEAGDYGRGIVVDVRCGAFEVKIEADPDWDGVAKAIQSAVGQCHVARELPLEAQGA